ncbi:transcriptional regulator, TetR family [Acinetobacter marinus]|uniref:Transcriptional regulator, TetR family n=1 Tax=Acinetobacter marinus TaxID=281375 RepID=A0A1G6H1I3_9GAMM|nr:TetR/AcrR family transcriptional regulator [Acinetobacter marinus]SDB87765.1 transcriptional regulator, TetR family [Acinetobacter marinus]
MKNSSHALQGRTYAGESLEDRQAKRRSQFIEAAYELFGTIGFRQTTVRNLCKQAGLTDRYFYESFQSIEQLLAEVYQREIGLIETAVLNSISTNINQVSVKSLIEQTLAVFFAVAENTKTAKIVWFEVLGVSETIDQLYISTIQNFANLFAQISLNVYPDLKISKAEVTTIAIGVIGAISQTTSLWYLSNYQTDKQTLIRSMSYMIQGTHLLLSQPNMQNIEMENFNE